MKTLVLLTALIAGLGVKADDTAAAMDKYVCHSDEHFQSVVLEQMTPFEWLDSDPDTDWEAEAEFRISLQTTELPFLDYTSLGVAKNADVVFSYTANDNYGGKKVSFFMYLDEPEASLTIGSKSFTYECKWIHPEFTK